MFQSPPPSMRKMMVASPAAIVEMEAKEAAVSDYYQSKLTASPNSSNKEIAFDKYAIWKARHEPTPLMSTSSSSGSPKSKDSSTTALDTLLDGLTNKVVRMLLDMACHIVEQVEDELDTADDDDLDDDDANDSSPKSTDSQLVNALRGYLLTLRFDTTSKRANAMDWKANAIQRLTTLLEQQLQRSSLALRQETMRAALVSINANTMSELIQTAWEEYSQNLMVEEECKENQKAAATATTFDADKLAILEIAGVSPPPITSASTEDDDTRQVGSQRLGNQLLALLKMAFAEKVENFPTHLSHTMDTILCEFALSKFMPPDSPTAGGKPVKPLKATDQMAAILESQYELLIQTVRTEIATVMHVCEGLMLTKTTNKADSYVGNTIGFGSGFGSGTPKGAMRGPGKFI